jgi:uncharacterized protein (TIGR02118 family)
MFKIMIMLTRRPDMPRDEFNDWWTKRHNRLAGALPRIRKIVFNVVDEGEISGIAELWFDAREDFAAALSTEAGQAAVADASAMVASLQILPVVEHEIPAETR